MAYEKCIAGIRQAAGRDLSDDEVAAIFERLDKAAKDIKAGRAYPADVDLGGAINDIKKPVSANVLFEVAAERAALQRIDEAEKNERQAYIQVLKMNGRVQAYKTLRSAGVSPMKALDMIVFRNYSGKANIESLEQRVEGVKAELMRKLQPAWDALGNDFLGLFQDEKKQIALLRELRNEDTGDKVAKAGAKAYHDTAEYGRQWFNEGGGSIGHLEDWGNPQHHSQAKAANAAAIVHGKPSDDPAVNRKAWVDRKLERIDKSKYVDDLGQKFSDAEIRKFLENAWETVSTNGIINITTGGQKGLGKIANRHAEHRSIHYKDAQSMIDDWMEFGDKSVVEILDGHIERMARDIAMIEYMGPNDKLTWQTIRDTALRDAVLLDRKNEAKYRAQAKKLDDYYDYSTGRITPSANLTFSGIMDGIAHLNTAGKGGAFMLSSLFGDRVMYQAVAHLNNIPKIQDWTTQLSLLNPANAADRRALQRQGLMLEAVRSTLTRFGDTFGTSNKFSSVTGKWANATMRVTAMTAINSIPKAAFGVGLMHAIGSEIKAGKEFSKLHESDVRTLKNYGISESDWKVWKLADLSDLGHGNDSVLLPENISRVSDDALIKAGIATDANSANVARRDAIVKLLGAVNTEADFAIVTPGWKERSQFHARKQRGGVWGEIQTAVLQFKSFPWTQFLRMADAVANADGHVGKALMGAYLFVATTLTGAMIMQVKDVLSGKDPRAMMNEDRFKFWSSAALQGGALGIYGDFLYGINETRYGSGPLETLAGPTIGPLMELGLVQPLNAAKKFSEGKETNLLAQTAQDLKGFVPGGNIWYTKAAMDHLIFQNVMEALSPGYLANMRRKTRKDYGQDWWWEPGEPMPDRAPDLGAAVGR